MSLMIDIDVMRTLSRQFMRDDDPRAKIIPLRESDRDRDRVQR